MGICGEDTFVIRVIIICIRFRIRFRIRTSTAAAAAAAAGLAAGGTPAWGVRRILCGRALAVALVCADAE
jgi:hypothetical protein